MSEKQLIDEILEQKHIAVAGVSRNSRKFGTIVYEHLKKNGYNVYPLNPNMESINGDRCYADVASLPSEVTALVTVTKPEITLQLVNEAAARGGISYLWMQQGSQSDEAVAAAEAHGIKLMQRKCIMMFAEPVKSVHSFHRFLLKLFGKYPK